MEQIVRTLDSRSLVVFKTLPSERVERYLERLLDKVDAGHTFPLVCFENNRKLLCVPEDFAVVGVKGNCEAMRMQIPLILAWAMSVHKSQGQTFERLKVDLKRAFEKGQGASISMSLSHTFLRLRPSLAYVALSRVKSMDGLQLLNFDRSKYVSI